MIPISDLSVGSIRLIGFGFYLLGFLAIACLVRAFGHPKAAKYIAVCVPPMVLCVFIAGSVSTYSYCIDHAVERIPLYVMRLLAAPLWAVLGIEILCLAAVTALLVALEKKIRRELSAQSVCEGLDQLPDGLCVNLRDGFPRLVNDRMQHISNAAFGMGVLNAQKLQRRFHEGDLLPGAAVEERNGSVFLRLPDGSVWHLKQHEIDVGRQRMTETVAYDVTARYNDLRELEQRTERLAEVNRQIKEYNRNMDRIVREREILSAKIRLHGNLGQSLLAVQRYLNQGSIDRARLTKELTRTVALLRNNETDAPDAADRLYALHEAAKAVDVQISLHGEIPSAFRDAVELAIRECLTNTVKHANGHSVDVNVQTNDDVTEVLFTNDGAPPAGPVKETGGLKNLRDAVERRGGTMTVESAPVFRLILRFARVI